MPEPTTHTALAVSAGASSATFAAGTVLGVEYAVVAIALLGGATALIYLARMEWQRMLASVVGSTVLGAVAAELSAFLVVPAAKHFAPWMVEALTESQVGGKMLVAFLVGFFAQKGVPVVFRWLESKGGVQ